MIDDVPAPVLAPASHIFIVGLSRTGTSLARAVLNANSSISIASGESHFFDSYVRSRARVAGDDGIGHVLDTVYGSPENRFWGPLVTRLARQELEARIRSSDRMDRALFDLAMEYHAGGRPIRGEKTPSHIHAVPTLLEWFPNARIIHTLRDPRAVYLSLRRKERDWDARAQSRSWAGRQVRRLGPIGDAYVMTKLIRDFRRIVRLHREFESRYPGRYLLLPFERVVGDPAATARSLCAFVGVEYSEAMLEQVVRNSSFVPAGSSGIDPSAADRWRRHLSRPSQRWFSLLCGREMAEFGYAP